MALFPQGLRCWGLQQYILVTESAKQQFFGFSLNQYSVRQVTAILKNLESAPVWQNWWSVGKTITVAARLGFSWKRQQPALPNQWELGSPLARKVPVQLRCLLFGIQAWSSTHNKWHVWQDPHTLPGNSTCLSASDSVLEESVSQKVEYVPCSQRVQTIRLFQTKFSGGAWHLLWQWLAPNIRRKWPFWKTRLPFSRICCPYSKTPRHVEHLRIRFGFPGSLLITCTRSHVSTTAQETRILK